MGLIWSAKVRRVERGGLAPPNKAGWNSSEGERQPRCASCTTMHELGHFEPHTDLQRVWLDRQFRLPFENRLLSDRNFVGD